MPTEFRLMDDTVTTAVRYKPLPPGVTKVSISVTEFAGGCSSVRVGFSPHLLVLQTADNGVTWAEREVQDAVVSDGIDLTNIPSGAGGGYVYLGSGVGYQGLEIVIGQANATASVLTAEASADDEWSELSNTIDGTIVTGASMGQSGLIDFDAPSAGTSGKSTLRRLGVSGSIPPGGGNKFYWVRLYWSAAFVGSCNISDIEVLPMTSTYSAELPENSGYEQEIQYGPGHYAAVAYKSDIGTATINISCESPKFKYPDWNY